MKPYHKDCIERLQREVATRNLVNEMSNRAGNALRLQFCEFAGMKVQKIDYSFTAKVAGIVEEKLRECGLFYMGQGLGYNKGYRFYVSPSSYSIFLEIDKTYDDPVKERCHCHYVKASVYVACLRNLHVSNDTLDIKPINLRCDYTVKEVLELRSTIQRMEDDISEVKGKAREFLEFRLYY